MYNSTEEEEPNSVQKRFVYDFDCTGNNSVLESDDGDGSGEEEGGPQTGECEEDREERHPVHSYFELYYMCTRVE